VWTFIYNILYGIMILECMMDVYRIINKNSEESLEWKQWEWMTESSMEYCNPHLMNWDWIELNEKYSKYIQNVW
jgi:hypothetical protein